EGQRIVVDQGVYEYVAGPRRQVARAAASHNTLCFAGGDQADFFGSFRCGRRPNVEVRRYEPRPDGFVLEGSHDGFTYLPGRPRHVRRFDVAAEHVRIEDRVERASHSQAKIGFLLHPDVNLACAGHEARLVRGNTAVRMSSSQPITVEAA